MPCPTCKQPVGDEKRTGEVSDDLLRRVIGKLNVLLYHGDTKRVPDRTILQATEELTLQLEEVAAAR